MNRRRAFLIVLIACVLSLCFAFTACQKKGDDKVEVTAVTLNEDEIELQMGETETATLTATVTPDNATDKTVTWSSSDEAVVTVSGGAVTAHKAGSATITATAGGKSDTCEVTVQPVKQNPTQPVAVTGVTLDQTTVALKMGGTTTATLTETVAPTNATNKKVTWTSSDPTVATVANGTITAVKAGKVTITVTTEDGNHSATCEVTVAAADIAVTGVVLDKATVSLQMGATTTEKLTATVAPTNATNKKVTWTSSDPTVATVANGTITAVKAGKVTITVTTEDGNHSATCEVTVAAQGEKPQVINVTGVTLDQTAVALKMGGTDHVTLNATIKPADATNKNVSWTSSDTKIATVKDGVVTAVAAGKVNITVTTEDGSKTATCEVTVAAADIAVTGVVLDKKTLSLQIGGTTTETLIATVAPTNATNKNVTWTSSDTNIVTVKDGVVTAVAEGKATITVTTVDGNKTATCEVTVAAQGTEPVNVPVTGVTLDQTTATLKLGTAEDHITLTATITPEDATNHNVTWTSSDTTIATVDHGIVTALKDGKVTITVTTVDGNHSATCEVTVAKADVAVTGVTLDQTTVTLKIGGTTTATLKATVEPADATNKNVTWKSSNEAIATVKDGVVTAVAEGTAVITVTTVDGNHTATCEVTVAKADEPQPPKDYTPNGVYTLDIAGKADSGIFTSKKVGTDSGYNDGYFKLSSSKADGADYLYINMMLPQGKIIKISGTGRSTNQTAGSGKTVTISTELKSGSTGTVTGLTSFTATPEDGLKNFEQTLTVSKEGTVVLQLSRTSGSTGCEYTEFTVEIKDPEIEVSLDKTTSALKVGETDTLTATVVPGDAEVVWTSSDEAIATVKDGVVTAVAAGTATITVTSVEDGTKKATCEVTVTNVEVTSVTLNTDTAKFAVGKTTTLIATISPDNATIKTVTWKSSDESVATVDNNGVVTAVAVGKATITATADGGKSATCAVEIVSQDIPVTSVTLNETSIAKYVGDTLQLTATVEPANAIDPSVEWTTSDAKIATVDQNGLVTVVGEGTVTITVTSNNNSQINAKCEIEATYQTFTVTFKDGSATVDTQTVNRGETATDKSLPPKEGYAHVGWYENADFSGTAYDFSKPVNADITLYANWIKSQIKITYQQGNCESAAVEWEETNPAEATVEYQLKGESEYVQVDKELIRDLGNGTARVDVLGLKGGKTYNIRVTSSTKGVSIVPLDIKKYDRSGYAHFNYTDGVGAYNDDGTLKPNAKVLYVTDETKNTVSVTVNGVTVTGIGNILNSVGQDVGGGATAKGGKPNTNQGIIAKLAEANTPLVVRFIGCVSNTGLYKKTTFDAASRPLIDGLTIHGSLDNGGSVDDNGHMARIKSGKDITLEGVGEDAVIDGWGFHFMAESAHLDFGKNFEVRNLMFINTPEDAIGMEGIQEGTKITAGVERCWIHNNEFYGPKISNPTESDKSEGDGSCDFKRGQYLTVSYNYFEGCHKTNLVGSSDDSLQFNLTYHHNYWKLCKARGPLSRHANIHMYNNVFDGQTDFAMNTRANAYIFSEYNLFYMCKNPHRVDAGAIKSYNDSFSSCIDAMGGKVVTDKSQTVANNCTYGDIDYSKFDTNAEQSYIPSGDYELQESVTEARKVIAALTGVTKRNAKSASDITLSEISYVPSGVTVHKVTEYPSDLTPGKISKTVYAFNIDHYATVTISYSGEGVLVNEAGECFLTGNGSVVLQPGTYIVQAMNFQPGDPISVTPGTFKDMTISSIHFEKYNSEEFDAQLIADYDAKAGLIKLDAISYDNESYQLIVNAQNAYNALSPELQAKVTVPYANVTAALDKYIGLGKTEVESLIDAIGTVNENSGSKITAARTAYDALVKLSPSVTVSNYSTLTAAEAAYENYKVTGLVNDINALAEASSVTEEQAIRDLLAEYQAMQTRYEALTSTQQAGVTNYKKVTDGITALNAKIAELEKAAAEEKAYTDIMAKLNAITDVETLSNNDCAEIVALYDKLSEAKKTEVGANATYIAVKAKNDEYASQAKTFIFSAADDPSLDGVTITGGSFKKSGAYVVNGTTYTTSYSIGSGSISFNLTGNFKMTVYMTKDSQSDTTISDGKAVKVNGTDYEATGSKATVESITGEVTITKGDSCRITYIVLEPVA